MYAKTLGGMEACYIAALPFFRNSIVTELVFSLLILVSAGIAQPFLGQTHAGYLLLNRPPSRGVETWRNLKNFMMQFSTAMQRRRMP